MSDYPGYTSPNAPEQPPVQPPPPAAKQKNRIGLAALIVAILGAIFALIPGAAVIGWVLLPIAFVLGVVGAVQSGKPKGAAVGAIVVSIVGTFIAIAATIFVVGTAIDDAFSSDDPVITTPTEDEPEDAGAAGISDTGEDAAHAEDGEDEPAVAGDLGSRGNPVPLGSTISGDEWDLTVLSFNTDAHAQIMDANMFNEEPRDGHVYALIESEVTYTGDDSGIPWIDISFAYVSESGNTFRGTDSMVVAPDPSFNDIEELYTGASGVGYTVVEIPEGDAGLLRVSVGMFGKDVFVATR